MSHDLALPTLFADRTQAGRSLVEPLTRYAGRPDVIVLALPRGGVPVAYEVATSLNVRLDLLVVRKGRRLGFEFKRTDQPAMTRSMHVALADLKLDELTVVVPGKASHPLAERVVVRGLRDFVDRA